LRGARYALPGQIGQWLPAPGVPGAARLGERLARQGKAATFGYFADSSSSPAANAAAYCRLGEALQPGSGVYLSVKAPQLDFDPLIFGEIAACGFELTLDAHAAHQADKILALAERFSAGCVLPARWRRSAADARRLRDGPGRIRLVKGEWGDSAGDMADPGESYLALAALLAGRGAVVSVATHDPVLARRALVLLQAAGTPCELEQLRGLPHRRTGAVAQELGVKVRVYVPFGPGWWPYAIDQALARPYLPKWWLEDWLGRTLNPGRAPAAA
jgi:proline dehydrogenase